MTNRQEISNRLHCLYKNLGETSLQSILRFKKDNPEYTDVPMTYAGRLDPMAEGLLLVLSGDATLDKEKYLGLPKTYVCEILWGFQTDTLDLLGLVSNLNLDTPCPSEESLKEMLEKSVGTFTQGYPVYSSKPVDGKPLFKWAREGKINEVEIPKHEVELFDAKFISCRSVSSVDLLRYIVAKISAVSGDFRQKEITEKWQDVMSKVPFDIVFNVDTLELKVSGGFYVRQFVSDLAEKFGTLATTFYIKRIKVGEFTIKNVEN